MDCETTIKPRAQATAERKESVMQEDSAYRSQSAAAHA